MLGRRIPRNGVFKQNTLSIFWCAEAMLRSAGFEITAHPEAEVYICRRRPLSPEGRAARQVFGEGAMSPPGRSRDG